MLCHLHEGLTHIQSQIKPRLLFEESFTLKNRNMNHFLKSNLENILKKEKKSSKGPVKAPFQKLELSDNYLMGQASCI